MKVQITCADSGFTPDININRNSDCIYYVNQRICLSPEAKWSFEKDNDGLLEHSAFQVAELIECLPGVYTRTLKTAIDECGADPVDMAVNWGAERLFTVIAAYLNAWNDFVKEHSHDHDGVTGLPKHYDIMYGKYIIGEELTAFKKRYSRIRSMTEELPDGRLVKVQFFFYHSNEDDSSEVTEYYDVDDATGFSFEIVEKED